MLKSQSRRTGGKKLERKKEIKNSFLQNRQRHVGAPERRRVPLVEAAHRLDKLRQVAVDVLLIKGRLEDRRGFVAVCRGRGRSGVGFGLRRR